MDNYIYRMKRIVCEGKIKSCEFCKDANAKTSDGVYVMPEGYCSKCGRPLWKKPGDSCDFILGYMDKRYKQEDKVHIKCKFCNSITTV